MTTTYSVWGRPSDTPDSEYELSEDGQGFEVFRARSHADALAYARAYDLSGADYGDPATTVWTDIVVRHTLSGEVVGIVTRSIDPVAPACIDGREHEWEDSRLQGHGAGVIIHQACSLCGCARTTDTWAQRPDTGEQGLTSVSYTDAVCDASLD